MKNDMTKGNIIKIILSFTFYMFLGNLFQQFYNIVDSIIVGNAYGENAIASISTTGPIVFMFIGLIIGISSGFGIKISHAFGAKKFDLLKKYHAMSIVLAIVISVLLSIILLIFNNFILKIINTPLEIYENTYNYIFVIYLGIVFTMLYNLCSSILRAVGNSRMPLIFLMISSFLNILLDIIFVCYFNYGVVGAAIATITTQLVSVILSYIYIFKKYEFFIVKKEDLKLDFKIMKELLFQGLPMGLQFFITAFGVMFVQMELNKYGPEYIAGFGVAGKIQGIVVQLFIAVGVAMANYVGQNFGAKDFSRIKKGILYSTVLSQVFSVVAFILVSIFGETFVILFVKNPSDVMMFSSKMYFDVVKYYYPFFSLLFIYRNSLQGLGRADLAMLGGVFELFARVGVVLFLSDYYGYWGICFSDSLAWLFALIPLIPLFFKTYKKEKYNCIN